MCRRAPVNISLRSRVSGFKQTAGEKAPATGGENVRAAVGYLILPRFQAEIERLRLGAGAAPIAVHKRGRLVSVEAAAEEAGLQVGMRLMQAQAVFPGAEFVLLAEDRGRTCRKVVLDLCVAHAGSVEPQEPNAVFLNLANLKQPLEALTGLRGAIEAQTGLTCRSGCGPSKLLARLAAHYAPGGMVAEAEAEAFLAPLSIGQLPNLDPKARQHLQALGITTIGLLQQIPPARLAEHFGRDARRLQDLARGLDHSPVQPLHPPREILVQQKLPGGTTSPDAVQACLQKLSLKIARELEARQEACGRITLRATLEEAERAAVSLRLHEPSQDSRDLLRASRVLMTRLNLRAPITSLALQASDCRRAPSRQLSLLFDRRPLNRRRDKVEKALEVIRQCFGHDIAILGGEIERPRRERLLAALKNGDCHYSSRFVQ